MGNIVKKFIEKNKDAYNTIAASFSATRSYLWEDLKPLRQYVKDGDSILDVGCGNGRLFQLFEGMNISYTGIDQSDELIQIAKKKFPKGTFIVGEMTKLPLLNATADIIFCIGAFHHLPTDETRKDTLQEMKRVLIQGGTIVMTNWNLQSEWGKEQFATGKWKKGETADHAIVPWKKDGMVVGERHYWHLTSDHIAVLADAVGIRVVEQYYTKKGEISDEKNGYNLVSVLRYA
ncbi:MAG TPA: methyltransferase domain-containing protein [Candidatus Kapabacteria bacterium]|nr:methyltransferase domain-containing protein [Candidatus Kapabacteria bacterium]